MPEITRREFLETGLKGAALLSVPAFFRFNPTAALASPSPETMNLHEYYDHFGVTESVIRDVMAAALERGGPYAF